jgi:ankyrin repeat protein
MHNHRRACRRIVLAAICLSLGSAWADPIHEAAKTGDLAAIRRLADADPGVLTNLCEMGKTPLHWATGKGQLAAIKLLVNAYSVDVNVRNANKGTPVHVAASQAQTNALRLLVVDLKANVNARTIDGSTPLHYAAIKRRPGHLACARFLLAHGADVNAKTKAGITPLTMARGRWWPNRAMVSLLEAKGGVARGNLRDMRKPQGVRMR